MRPGIEPILVLVARLKGAKLTTESGQCQSNFKLFVGVIVQLNFNDNMTKFASTFTKFSCTLTKFILDVTKLTCKIIKFICLVTDFNFTRQT